MKKFFVFFIFSSWVFYASAQNTAKDVFTRDEIIWYGLDFSKSKMIGQFDQGAGANPVSGSEIKMKYIPAWNMLVLNEPEKYNLKQTFRKISVFKDITTVEKSNYKIDPDKIFTYNDYKFENSKATIEEIINSYEKGEKTEGIGLVFIVEFFSKPEQKASVFVVFFDIATKKVLFSDHLFGKPMGFGIRNYWGGAIYDILKQIDSGYYKMWTNYYGK